jgi:hypothetical protein
MVDDQRQSAEVGAWLPSLLDGNGEGEALLLGLAVQAEPIAAQKGDVDFAPWVVMEVVEDDRWRRDSASVLGRLLVSKKLIIV